MSINNIESIATIDQFLVNYRDDLINLLKLLLIDLREVNSYKHKQYICERPTFRFKSAESIYEKTLRKNLNSEDFASKIKDLLGVRAICLDLSSVDKVMAKLLGSTRIEVVEQKRWIEMPDDDGYRGIHLIFTARNKELLSFPELKAEIQIRTVAQHFWASFSHRDIYKSKRTLLNRTSDRIRILSDTLYQSDCELERLESEIKDDPLAVNTVTLQSLLKHLGYNVESAKVDVLYSMLREHGLDSGGIPTIQIAILSRSEEIDDWIKILYDIILKTEPQMVEVLFCHIYGYFNGLYWPKRRLFEWVLNQSQESWSKILGSNHSKDLVILIEAAREEIVDKYIYTWRSLDKRSIVWSFIIDNRYTTKRLSELGLIKTEFQENITSRETPIGSMGKHCYRIKCTPRGLEIATKCSSMLFCKTDCMFILDELEKEDFPEDDQLNWGLPRSADVSISTQPRDEGPVFIDHEWWSGTSGYY